MQTLLQNVDFTGSNGSAWPTNQTTWTLLTKGAAGSATVQSNRGRLTTGASGSYLDTLIMNTGVRVSGPVEVSGSFTLPNPYIEAYHLVGVGDGTRSGDDPTNGFSLKLDFLSATSLDVLLGVTVGGVLTTLTGPNFTHTAGSTTKFRLRSVDGALKAKVWETTDEPVGIWPYQWATTVQEFTAGFLNLRITCGAAAVANSIDFDDLRVDSLLPTVPIVSTYRRN